MDLRRKARTVQVSVDSGARSKSPDPACQWEIGSKKGRKNTPQWEKDREKRRFKSHLGGGIGFFCHIHPRNSYFSRNHHFFNPRFQVM
jgi:hypothetical protein